MAAAVATHSYGSTLGYGSASTSFTNLTDVVDIDIDGFKVASTKTTHLLSPNAFHEYTPGLGDAGMLTLTINYDKTTYNTLYGFVRTLKWWKVTAADSGNFICQGHIEELPVKIPDDDRMTDNIKIKLTGKPTFATS